MYNQCISLNLLLNFYWSPLEQLALFAHTFFLFDMNLDSAELKVLADALFVVTMIQWWLFQAVLFLRLRTKS
jgi:hypothetical protein